jgi:ribosomal protein S18 acetylase RimI-like enzyme
MSLDGITAADLAGGFWVGWPDPPSPERHLEVLRGSELVVLAIDETVSTGSPGRVVGFVTAVGDGVLAASIPLLEVLPAWQGQRIGSELVRRVVAAIEPRYMVDLVCDEPLVGFYERLGFTPYRAMIRRDRGAIMTTPDRYPGDDVADHPDGGPDDRDP